MFESCALPGVKSMAISDEEYERALQTMSTDQAAFSAESVTVDTQNGYLDITFPTGVNVRFPIQVLEGLQDANPEQLKDFKLSPSGLGLHWQQIGTDLYIPALIEGAFGSRDWMTQLSASFQRRAIS